MRKVTILCAAFFAVLAFGALSVTAASAAQWLDNGAAITTPQHATTTGKWKLTGLSFFGAVKTVIECTWSLLGTVGAGGNDEITEVLGLSGEKNTVDCTVSTTENGGCLASTLALVTAEHLPWKTVLLAGTTTPVDHFTGTGGEVAFKVECTLNNGTKFSELCEGNLLTKELTNDALHKDVKGTLLNALATKCNSAGAVSHIDSEVLISLLNGDTLTVDN